VTDGSAGTNDSQRPLEEARDSSILKGKILGDLKNKINQ